MKKNNIARYLIYCLLSIGVFISLIATTSPLVDANQSKHYWYDFTQSFSLIFSQGNSFESVCIFFLFLLFSQRLFILINNFKGFALSLLFVFIYLVCDNYNIFSKFQTFHLPKLFYLVFFIKLLGLSYLLYCIAILLCKLIQNSEFKFKPIKISNKRYFFYSLSIIFLFWIPYFIINFPGNATFDGLYQISMGLKLFSPSDHHPWISSLIFANIADLFNFRGTTLFLFPVTCFIFITLISLFSLSCLYWKKIFNIYFYNNIFIWLAPLFFAIIPIYPNYGQTIMKDGVYCASLCLFFSAFIYFILSTDRKRDNLTPLILISSALLCMCFRHNGAYIILPNLGISILAFIILKRNIKALLLIFCVLTACQLCYKLIILPSSNIKKGSVVETLALPSQTLAYILKEKESLSKNDQIKALQFFNSIEGVKKNFKKEISDNIKPYVKLPLTFNHAKAFASICWRHKGSCIRGFLGQTYLYFYPKKLSSAMPVVYNYNDTFESISKNTNGFVVPAPVNYFFSDKIRKPLIYWTEFWTYTFPFSLFMGAAFSTWILLAFICSLALIKVKTVWYLIPLVPILVLLLNMLSPVNGDSRYSLPCMSFEPILLLLMIILIKGQNFRVLSDMPESKISPLS